MLIRRTAKISKLEVYAQYLIHAFAFIFVQC